MEFWDKSRDFFSPESIINRFFVELGVWGRPLPPILRRMRHLFRRLCLDYFLWCWWCMEDRKMTVFWGCRCGWNIANSWRIAYEAVFDRLRVSGGLRTSILAPFWSPLAPILDPGAVFSGACFISNFRWIFGCLEKWMSQVSPGRPLPWAPTKIQRIEDCFTSRSSHHESIEW